ncbi:type II toxin-antitoxin system HicB family antitoxin [Novispirillum itersonii]|uniref:Putative RNase H-like HicB family nuclease n=1 Tax=Novispirillum itersonii TaxID=189 RepID=A0A7X0DN41_NOVIT|nr:type II toxin-antitoxin system HicB family antitoxin [Novispirillum itersonii]MBB6211711.1 putative RNase H-like HicB family nuclease [Novispirillum itersonii]
MYRMYPAVLEPSGSGYAVFFPDLPGCTSGGVGMETAVINAHEALAMHLQGMTEDGAPMPPATPLRQVQAEHDEAAYVALVRVRVFVDVSASLRPPEG